ncbi:cytoplasmic protein [Bacillus sp. 4048]|uniref:AHH domain-containing protein n=1 Tax=Bacillus TaxID=1386 RepID=UPI00077ABCC9|nr:MULTISPECIES: AHH domain-containing protein [Bacillus]KAA0767896.1 cytoplasmic protein [Bacillus sp. BB51/4]KXY00279.1 cytoplasmic protein [Bacillus wiedmannii]OAK32072.1 cytoplasmic protein [Bacillus wiedmannii]OJD44510.1 cytoplasmic protein [Bacillus sp. 4048]TCD31890.1 cytoplasmic protein [Bacillus wiedmannii]
MSLNMYLGEVQSQTQSMNAVCNATIQGMEQVIQSIDTFAIDTVLQGQTYSSAKSFFVQTFRPLAHGIIYLCEELIRQNDAFPSQFQSQVASTDVIEQEILEQIREIDRMKVSMEAISQAMPIPGMDAMANLFTVMRKKLQEKLEHLYEFNSTSSSNYDTALQLAVSIATGLAEVQSGKGFSPASGTFSTQGLNMEWTTSIQAIGEERASQASNLLNDNLSDDNIKEEEMYDDTSPEKSMLRKVWDGIYVGSGQVIGEIVEGFNSLDDTVTKENIKYAIGHPLETAYTMCNTFSDSFMNDVWHGDLESGTKWGTSIFMEFGLGWIGDKGISTVGKVTTLGEGVNLAKFSTGISSVANKLPLTERFAFAGASGFGSAQRKASEMLQEARDTFMFSKTGGRSRVKDVQEVIKDYADKVLDRVDVKNDYPDSYTASQKLRAELKEAGIEPPPYPNAAHHIGPWNDKRAAQVQELLEEFGIHHDSAANGVFLPYKVNDYVTTEALHIGNHSPEYIREVYRVLSEVKRFGGNQADAVAALQNIRERLLDGSLKLNQPK